LPLPTNMPGQTVHISAHSMQRLAIGQKTRLRILHTRPDGPVQAKVEEFSVVKIQ
jgi:tRNA U54 and U55 pseudouridine synthase Pus10